MRNNRTKPRSKRFAKAAQARGPRPGDEPAPERGRTAARSAPYRTTVDLSPADHRRLRRLADDLDVGEIPRRAVWLALLAELDSDETLYARVRERLAED